MPVAAAVFAALAAVLHVLIFVMESVLWARPQVWRRFAVPNQSDADVLRPMAFNQGFYNLFLALGIFGGLIVGEPAATPSSCSAACASSAPHWFWSAGARSTRGRRRCRAASPL